LYKASKNGTWKPDLLLVSSVITPKILEMILIMPDLVFNLSFYLLDLFPNSQVISPGQLDLMEGRKTMTAIHLNEMVEVSSSEMLHSSLYVSCDYRWASVTEVLVLLVN
jgi:hypothetical protein